MNILVTGGAGYLGSILVPKLLVRGHRVRVVDIGYFGMEHLRNLRPAIELVRADLRRVLTDKDFCNTILDNCDRVIHLAAISNDPSAEAHPELTDEVNFRTTVALADATRRRGVRFLFSSSCSVYGEADGDLAEDAEVKPLTCYAVSKVRSEHALRDMATTHWRPVILRNGTLFGYSPRMRFDLVVNIFALYSTLRDEIQIFGDGRQWRPFLSVQDCARAFVHMAELAEPRHICYNIAHENLRVIDLAGIFRRINPRLQVAHTAIADPDQRDYRASVSRARDDGFRSHITVMAGAERVAEAIVGGLIPDPESIFYRNAKWLKELTDLSSVNHFQLVDLMEKFRSVRSTAVFAS